MVAVQKVYFQDQNITVRQPKVPLAPGAVEIVVKDDANTYDRVFDVYSKLQQHWTTGTFYLERREGQEVTRQIIPYPTASTFRKVQVTWNLLFPSLAWTNHSELGDITKALNADAPKRKPATAPGNDPFCTPTRINAQKASEKKTTNLLYNYRPITRQDFLITTKKHQQVFDRESFVEAMNQGRDLAQKNGKITYLNIADSKASGQTVPHAHLHVTIAASTFEEATAIAKVAANVLLFSWFPYNPFQLSDAELKVKIAEFHKE